MGSKQSKGLKTGTKKKAVTGQGEKKQYPHRGSLRGKRGHSKENPGKGTNSKTNAKKKAFKPFVYSRWGGRQRGGGVVTKRMTHRKISASRKSYTAPHKNDRWAKMENLKSNCQEYY